MLTEVVSQAKNAAGAVLDIGMNFESGMSKVQAISGASGEDLAALTDKAKEMGAKTKFSATESAEAMQYMAMAGWKNRRYAERHRGYHEPCCSIRRGLGNHI